MRDALPCCITYRNALTLPYRTRYAMRRHAAAGNTAMPSPMPAAVARAGRADLRAHARHAAAAWLRRHAVLSPPTAMLPRRLSRARYDAPPPDLLVFADEDNDVPPLFRLFATYAEALPRSCFFAVSFRHDFILFAMMFLRCCCFRLFRRFLFPLSSSPSYQHISSLFSHDSSSSSH